MNALEMVTKLGEYFNANLSETAIGVYLDGLAQLERREAYLPEILYDVIYPVILRESKWMPKISEIGAIAWKSLSDQLIEENRRYQLEVRAKTFAPFNQDIDNQVRAAAASRLGVPVEQLDQAMEALRRQDLQ